MVGYDDPYNAALTRESNARARQHGLNIDRLNGSGKAAPKNEKMTGGMMCPAVMRPVTDPETGKVYDNSCKMAAAKRGPMGMGTAGSRCCARCRNCKCGGGMSGGAADTPIPAREWFKAEDQAFKRAVAQTITPKDVASNRMSKDLGAGKCASKGGSMATRNVTPQGLTPPTVAIKRMNKDLGAGKMKGGAREESETEDDEDYEDGDDCGEMEGGGVDEPETLREMKSICDDYEQKKLTGGAMTKRIRAMLPHGKKKMSVALSKALQKLKKRGRASFSRRVQQGMLGIKPEMPAATQLKSGRYVGGSKDHPDIERIHDSVFGGSKLTGGYGPVAPTTEALAGYDNRNQPKGLMPPPSVNQQPGLRGGALPLKEGYPAEPQPTQKNKGRPRAIRGGFMPDLAGTAQRVAGMFGTGMSAGQMMYPGGDPNWGKMPQNYLGGQQLIPENQLPSRIGGGKGKMTGGLKGRTAPNGDYIGPSTGAISPNLQSEVSPAGSGKRGSRGAMVAKLMREKGMSLGEASRALKGGAYTANDFFMPRNIHQFFGAYA
jgi:hypothetical protein